MDSPDGYQEPKHCKHLNYLPQWSNKWGGNRWDRKGFSKVRRQQIFEAGEAYLEARYLAYEHAHKHDTRDNDLERDAEFKAAHFDACCKTALSEVVRMFTYKDEMEFKAILRTLLWDIAEQSDQLNEAETGEEKRGYALKPVLDMLRNEPPDDMVITPSVHPAAQSTNLNPS